MGDLLQGTDGRKGLFIDELLIRWKKTQRQAVDSANLFVLKEPVSSPGKKYIDVCLTSATECILI